MRLRDVILGARSIDATTLAQAEAHATQTQSSLAHVLVAFKIVDGRKLARLLSRALHFEVIDVGAVEIHPRLLEIVPRHAAEQLRVLPIGVQQGQGAGRLFLAMSDPTDDVTIARVEEGTGFVVEPLVCDDAVLQQSLDKHYGAVVVGAVLVDDVGGNDDYLTESTAEALQLLQAVRADGPQRATARALGENTLEMTRPRPVSMPSGDVQTAVHPRPRSLASIPAVDTASHARPFFDAVDRPDDTREHQRPFIDNEPTLAHDEPLFDVDADADADALEAAIAAALDADAPTLQRQPMVRPTLVPPATVPTMPTRAGKRVIVATRQSDGRLKQELGRLLHNVEVVLDDVAACHVAVDQLALVLIEPLAKSTLLRALLDLEEAVPRPKIVVVGGAPAFAVLAFIDHHIEVPDDPRAVAIAVVAGLRQIGVTP